jgi:uncharacterized protein YlxW (UPF0749 family)
VLAEVDESSTTRIDERLRKHGGMVFRRLPAELIEDQLVAESADFEAKLQALAQKLEQAVVEKKTAVQKDVEQVKRERKAMQDQAKARLDQAKAEMAAKLKALQDQAKGVDERVKARIERRIADLNANFNLRSSKLNQASTFTNER